MTFVWGIIGLSFLIFFHELGHFTFGRLFGIKVESFSIGMGPVLLHKKIKGTDFRISLLPLGGYCGFKDEGEFSGCSPDTFYGCHPLKRLVIAFAGPFYNMIFAFFALFVIAMTGYQYYSAGNGVRMADNVYPEIYSSAHASGMMDGDIIIGIDGKKIIDFAEISEAVSPMGGKSISVTLIRNGETLDLNVPVVLDKETGVGKIGILGDPESVILREYPSHGFFGSIKEGALQCNRIISLTFKGIGTLFKGVKITSAVSGPVRITNMLGETVQLGFAEGFRTGVASTLQFLAIISISLFFTNLLPLPVLDGGIILFALAEIVLKRKLPQKVLKYIQIAGIAIIATIFAVAVTGDVMYFIGKGK